MHPLRGGVILVRPLRGCNIGASIEGGVILGHPLRGV